jgi:hypothetical protein
MARGHRGRVLQPVGLGRLRHPHGLARAVPSSGSGAHSERTVRGQAQRKRPPWIAPDGRSSLGWCGYTSSFSVATVTTARWLISAAGQPEGKKGAPKRDAWVPWWLGLLTAGDDVTHRDLVTVVADHHVVARTGFACPADCAGCPRETIPHAVALHTARSARVIAAFGCVIVAWHDDVGGCGGHNLIPLGLRPVPTYGWPFT